MTHPTAVEAKLARRRRTPLRWGLRLLALAVLVVLILGLLAALRLTGSGTPLYRGEVAHFRYGSIGSEIPSGIPARVWHALPRLYPDAFEGRDDYAAFGFLYAGDRPGAPALPIGIAERNLSAALGAGVTPASVDHRAVQRVAAWLADLEPPPSPHAPDAEAVARGRPLYMEHCAAWHGYQGEDGYVFEGAKLGTVEPIATLGTGPARLNSYTQAFSDRQKAELFAGTPHAFRRFRKTDGYANAPLDGLWLRGPYLHNGSVPTLADLLAPRPERPVRFIRDSDVLDPRGGFVSPPCAPGTAGCFDTTLLGNSNAGHLYGTDLTAVEKAELLAYLLTF